MSEVEKQKANELINNVWTKLGADIPETIGDNWLLDGPYGDVLRVAEEESRAESNKVSLQILFQALVTLRQEHSQLQVA